MERTFSLETTCCIVSAVLPVFSRRNATSRDSRCGACSTVGVKETPEEFHRLKVHTSQDMRRSTRDAATLKCLFFPFHLYTMLSLQPSAWAPGTSQLMSGQHYELFVGLVVSEMLLSDASQHHTTIIQAGPSSRWESQLGITGAE